MQTANQTGRTQRHSAHAADGASLSALLLIRVTR